MKSRRVVSLLLLVLAVAPLAIAQQVSQKKDIAVFKLSYYQWDIPDSVLGGIDEEIRGVFVNIGRFNVLGMTQRLEPGDLSGFIDRIKAFKEVRAEMPELPSMRKLRFMAGSRVDFIEIVRSRAGLGPEDIADEVLSRERAEELYGFEE